MKKILTTALLGGAVVASLISAGSAEARVCRDWHGRFTSCYHVDLPNLPNVNLPSVNLPSAPSVEVAPAPAPAPAPAENSPASALGAACNPEGATTPQGPDGAELICVEDGNGGLVWAFNE